MIYEAFHSKGESAATTLDRVTTYVAKMAILALPVDRSHGPKASFVPSVTRGTFCACYTKRRISPTTSYGPVIQAFATWIRDRVKLEAGKQCRGAQTWITANKRSTPWSFKATLCASRFWRLLARYFLQLLKADLIMQATACDLY